MPENHILSLRDAIKASQTLFRDLEKAARARDDARLAELASRYESSINDLMQSVDAAESSRSYAKDLDLAQRSLSRWLQQIQQMAEPLSAADLYWRLTDALVLARDDILAQQEALRVASAGGGSSHQGSTSHGCGSRRLIFLR